MVVKDLLYSAFRAARILKSAGSGASANDLADGLAILNDIVDEWSARKAYSWNETFTAFTLTPNHQPHLIGPTATAPDFTLAARPVRIESAALILTGNTAVDLPLQVRDDAWWAKQRVKNLTSTIPTDLYYSADIPNGQIWLWPVPTVAYGLRIQTWVTLAPFVTTNDTVTVPPAYTRALKLTLAEQLQVNYGIPANPLLTQNAAQARRALESNNIKSPRVSTIDAGVGSGRDSWNYLTGTR